jgi:hypothetical protein
MSRFMRCAHHAHGWSAVGTNATTRAHQIRALLVQCESQTLAQASIYLRCQRTHFRCVTRRMEACISHVLRMSGSVGFACIAYVDTNIRVSKHATTCVHWQHITLVRSNECRQSDKHHHSHVHDMFEMATCCMRSHIRYKKLGTLGITGASSVTTCIMQMTSI